MPDGIKKDPTVGEMSMGMGVDVKDTKQITGEASRSSTWKAENNTGQYTTGNIPKGDLGGKARG